MRKYYVYWYRLYREESFLIWFSTDDKDGFVFDQNGLIPSFKVIEELQEFAAEKQISVDAESPNLLDLDIVNSWVNETSNEIGNYDSLLEAWNLFDDISISANGSFDADKELTNNICNKIFSGCNLPAMTPEGKSFTPSWTKKELKILRETLKSGFQLFKEKVKNA